MKVQFNPPQCGFLKQAIETYILKSKLQTQEKFNDIIVKPITFYYGKFLATAHKDLYVLYLCSIFMFYIYAIFT